MEAAFYAYAAPEPDGFKVAFVKPEKAIYSAEINEFFLMYDVRNSADPEKVLAEFLDSAYDAAADLAKWKRDELEGK